MTRGTMGTTVGLGFSNVAQTQGIVGHVGTVGPFDEKSLGNGGDAADLPEGHGHHLRYCFYLESHKSHKFHNINNDAGLSCGTLPAESHRNGLKSHQHPAQLSLGSIRAPGGSGRIFRALCDQSRRLLNQPLSVQTTLLGRFEWPGLSKHRQSSPNHGGTTGLDRKPPDYPTLSLRRPVRPYSKKKQARLSPAKIRDPRLGIQRNTTVRDLVPRVSREIPMNNKPSKFPEFHTDRERRERKTIFH